MNGVSPSGCCSERCRPADATGTHTPRPLSPALPIGARSCRESPPSRVCPCGARDAEAVGRSALEGGLSRRQDRLAREDGPAASAGAVTGDWVTASGQAGGRCGVTALRQRPAPCVPTLRRRARLPPHDAETPLPQPPTTQCPRRPTHFPRFARALARAQPGPDGLARPEGVPLTDSKETPHPAACLSVCPPSGDARHSSAS